MNEMDKMEAKVNKEMNDMQQELLKKKSIVAKTDGHAFISSESKEGAKVLNRKKKLADEMEALEKKK